MGGYSLKTKAKNIFQNLRIEENLLSFIFFDFNRPQSHKATKHIAASLSVLVSLWPKSLTPLFPYFLIPLLLFPLSSQSQAVRARLQFKTDSVLLGKSMELQMELMHPSHIEVMFPQKRDFLPYDLVNRQALESEINGNIVTEIVSFQVRSFDVAPNQAITLPYEFIRGSDTLEGFVSSDSLPFAARIIALDSTYQFKIHQGTIPLKDPPNYAQIFLLCLGVIGVLVLSYYVFRKPIQKWLRLQRLKTEWKTLQQELGELGKDGAKQAEVLDKLNHIWKTYADPQDSHSLKSLTTTELKNALPAVSAISHSHQSFLLNLIQKSDQVIYAGQRISANELQNFLEQSGSLLEELYQYHRKGVA